MCVVPQRNTRNHRHLAPRPLKFLRGPSCLFQLPWDAIAELLELADLTQASARFAKLGESTSKMPHLAQKDNQVLAVLAGKRMWNVNLR